MADKTKEIKNGGKNMKSRKKGLRSNNEVVVVGKLEKEFEYSHTLYGENFYENRLIVGNDFIPILVSERLVDVSLFNQGKIMGIKGRFNSYNDKIGSDGRTHLKLYVFALELWFESEAESEYNKVTIRGFVCKEPDSHGQITNLLIAVNRAYGKSDYLPCMTLGDNAKIAAKLQVGDEIQIEGMIQSREYLKCSERRVAYEIYVEKMHIL